MTDIELVIKIPEDIYRRVVVSPRCATFLDAFRDRDMFVEALQTGTPLPKGHGRLIDADSLKETEQKWSCNYEPDGFSHVVEISDIDEEPTVIEADKVVREN